jgi:hypothetical protein
VRSGAEVRCRGPHLPKRRPRPRRPPDDTQREPAGGRDHGKGVAILEILVRRAGRVVSRLTSWRACGVTRARPQRAASRCSLGGSAKARLRSDSNVAGRRYALAEEPRRGQ